jgi:hypothetical protein
LHFNNFFFFCFSPPSDRRSPQYRRLHADYERLQVRMKRMQADHRSEREKLLSVADAAFAGRSVDSSADLSLTGESSAANDLQGQRRSLGGGTRHRTPGGHALPPAAAAGSPFSIIGWLAGGPSPIGARAATPSQSPANSLTTRGQEQQQQQQQQGRNATNNNMRNPAARVNLTRRMPGRDAAVQCGASALGGSQSRLGMRILFFFF